MGISEWFRRRAAPPPARASGALADAAPPLHSALSTTTASIAAPSTLAAAPPLPGVAVDATLVLEAPVAWREAFFERLLARSIVPGAPLGPDERRWLAQVDQLLLHAPASRSQWLPRASSVVPRLLRSLREESESVDAMAHRMTQDPQLVAEAIRMANGVGAAGADARVTTLPDAIRRIGVSGVQRVVARVLLRPLFDAHGGTLSAVAAPHLRAHSEAQAEACMQLVAEQGLDPFDGYVAGLLHDIGWTAALRALDPVGAAIPAEVSDAFVHALEPKRERLFATLAGDWHLSPAIDALAAEILATAADVQAAPGVLRRCLAAADRSACDHITGTTSKSG